MIGKCYQLGSLLLVMLFLSIAIIQSVHTHDREVRTEQSAIDQDSLSNSDWCKLCDYFIHKQDKQLFLSYPPVVVPPLPEPVSYTTEIFVGNYKFTLQGFTNKGPPSPLS